MKGTFFGPGQVKDWAQLERVYGKSGSATTAYVRAALGESQRDEFTPVGAAPFGIVNKLAWENPGLRGLADHYRRANLPGSGKGRMRLWDASIYSDETRDKVYEDIRQMAGSGMNGR
jgi:hypothetical protein